MISLILGCFAGYDPYLGDELVLSRIFVFFPFYWAGYCAGRREEFKTLLQPAKKVLRVLKTIAGALILAGWALLCFFGVSDIYVLRRFFSGKNSFEVINEDFALSFEGLIIRALCYTLTALLCLALLWVMPDRKIPVLSKMGERSLSVYFWHRPIIYILEAAGVLDFLFSFRFAGILCICAAAALSLILGFKVFYRPFVWLKRKICTEPLNKKSITDLKA